MFNTRTMLLALAVLAATALLIAGSVDACSCGGRGYGAGYRGYSAGYAGYSVGYSGCDSCYAPACSSCSSCSSCATDAPACSSCSSGATYAPACSSCSGGTCATSYYGGYYPTYYWSYPTYYWAYPTYYQSYYPAYYPTYYSPVYDAGCSSCQGSTINYSSAYSTVVSNTPKAAPVAARPAPSPAPVADDASTRIVFSVRVPADAKVYVNDLPTTTAGTERTFIARGLKPGSLYGFTVRSERAVAGRTVSETQVLRLTPGQNGQLAFTLQPAATVVSQQVPPLVKLVSLH